jgi:UDP-2,3-diacylglucosamine pyrophosphatase LpxH
MTVAKRVYVISDLHLGGAPGTNKEDRGFRMCTNEGKLKGFIDARTEEQKGDLQVELVINGDMIDFVAEDYPDREKWTPFKKTPELAVHVFNQIADRTEVDNVLKSLRALLKVEGEVTILLGNHDVELSLQSVRAKLTKALEAEGNPKFRMLCEGQAYAIDTAIIEHGDQYDRWNQVDYGDLILTRAKESRTRDPKDALPFDPPAGSKLVSEVMNPIKKDYKFVDLLKPEETGVVLILLALKPSYAAKIVEVAPLIFESIQDYRPRTFEAYSEGEAVGVQGRAAEEDPLLMYLMSRRKGQFGPLESDFDYLGSIKGVPDPAFRDAPSGAPAIRFDATRGVTDWIREFYHGVREFFAEAIRGAIAEMSLPLLLDSLRLLQDETTFERTEVNEEDCYYKHALKLAEKGYKYVILGHTHLAKKIEIGKDAVYFNTGTWADLIEIPDTILNGDRDVAMALLKDLMSDIEASELKDWIRKFTPTHVRLDLDGNGKIIDAKLMPE